MRLGLVLVAILATFPAVPVDAARGPDCRAYVFQEDAQLVHESGVWDPTLLDPDGDGIACTELPSLIDGGVRRWSPPDGKVTTAVVTAVVDGDTIDVLYGPKSKQYRVRLISVDAPESTRQKECYGKEASGRVKELLPAGTEVWLVKVSRNADENGRLLRHVWFLAPDGTYRLLEHELTREGFAEPHDYGDGSPFTPYIADGYRVANLYGAGMFGACGAGAPDRTGDVTAVFQGRAPALPGATVALGAASPAGYTWPVADVDCPDITLDYARWLLAQDPSDPFLLDGDFDGIPCEGPG